jgi:putative N6-adenine-specific DNA methylase
VKTLAGLEEVLADELRSLGAQNIEKGTRSVFCETDWEGVYRLNLCLSTALRVLIPIVKFEAENEKELYDCIQEIPWEKYVSSKGSIAVDAIAQGEVFRHSHYVALKTKDAIVDRFRSLVQERPDVDIHFPDLRINIHNFDRTFTVSLDTSGTSLHRRGYREAGEEAPLNEVLAAGMIRLSQWNKDSVFVDPMCGSGTLLIEAAFFAHQIAPNKYRKEGFCFQRWPNYDAALWNKVKAEALKKEVTSSFGFYGGDIRESATRASKANIKSAGLANVIAIETRSFEKSIPPPPPGILMVNPPYDARLSLEDANHFYKKLGDRLKSGYQGYQAWIITGNPEAAKSIGLRTSRKIALFNGNIPCKLLKFELYAGSKKVINEN